MCIRRSTFSNTEQSDESWPIEPLAPQLARANKKYKSANDLMYAYAHTPLDEDTIKLTSFSSEDKLFAFIRGFYGLKGLPNFFTKQMSTFFKTLIEQGFALVYLDDTLLLSNSKEHMFQLIEQLHIVSTKNSLKLAPEKSFFMLLKVKFLGHEIGYNTIKPIHSKIAAIHKIPSPTGKVALMSFIGALNFYTKFIEKLHINLKPFYDILHENTPWKWTDEHESLFQKLKMSLTSETELIIPNTKHPFFITVDASFIGLGAVLFQLNEQNKMKVISFNSRILNPQEQKLSTLDRELLGIVHALQIYEFLIIGSPHPKHNFTDHKPLLHCFTKKSNLSPRFYRAPMQLTKFSKLKIIHTPLNYRISMDTKGPINPPSHNKSYIHVIIDAFSHFVVTVPIKSNNAKTAIKTLLHHWIIKFGPPIYLVTDRESEYVNKEMAHLCTLMRIRHSPRTAYSPWTNGLVEVQNRNLGTHLRMFLHDTPKDWAFQVHMHACAHNSQPLSELSISPHEIVFHTRPRIPITFDLNLNRDTSKTCISRYCSQLPEHSHYDKSDLNPFFYKTLSKPIPHWFLAVETAMLQIYSRVYENTLRKINSHAYITKTYHEGKPLPIGTFVLKRNFTHVHFSYKLKPLQIGPYKINDRLSDVTYELLAQDGSTTHVHRNHLIPYYPKEPLLYPHLRSFMRFSDTTQFQIPQPTKYANSDSSPFNSDESLSDEDSQTFMTPSTTDNSSQTFVTRSSFSTSNQNTPSTTSNDKSLTSSTNDNSLYRHIINTPHTNIPSDRSRHSSNNQTTSLQLTELLKLLINYDNNPN